MDHTLFKFLMVGVINTIVGCGTMFLLYNLFHFSYWFSSAANYVVGGIVSFFLNKYFTFQSKKWSWAQVCKFILTLAICYLAAYGIARPVMKFIFSGYTVAVQENIAMFTGMCLYTCLNYLGQKFFAFK